MAVPGLRKGDTNYKIEEGSYSDLGFQRREGLLETVFYKGMKVDEEGLYLRTEVGPDFLHLNFSGKAKNFIRLFGERSPTVQSKQFYVKNIQKWDMKEHADVVTGLANKTLGVDVFTCDFKHYSQADSSSLDEKPSPPTVFVVFDSVGSVKAVKNKETEVGQPNKDLYTRLEGLVETLIYGPNGRAPYFG